MYFGRKRCWICFASKDTKSSCAGYVKLGIPATNETKKKQNYLYRKKPYAKKTRIIMQHIHIHTHTHSDMMRDGRRVIRPSQTKAAECADKMLTVFIIYINLSCGKKVFDTNARAEAKHKNC